MSRITGKQLADAAVAAWNNPHSFKDATQGGD